MLSIAIFINHNLKNSQENKYTFKEKLVSFLIKLKVHPTAFTSS